VLVARKVPEAIFVIAGDGPLRSKLERFAADEGIASKTRFLGIRDDVPVVLAALDVFALTSLWEGLPLTVMEAMAAAKPVVATAVNGVPELVEDGVTGFLAPPQGVEQLAVHVTRLLKDSALAEQMGRAGRQRIETRFTVEHMVTQLADLYRRLHRMKCSNGIRPMEKVTEKSGVDV
jgi:glycosyltransferase involved in cell wall biosynthesis